MCDAYALVSQAEPLAERGAFSACCFAEAGAAAER